jgi:predicted nucleotidyltransferase
VRRLSFVHLPRYVFGALTGRFGPGAVSLSDLDEFIVSGDEAVAYHVDGESLEPASKVHVRPAPHVLSVLV